MLTTVWAAAGCSHPNDEPAVRTQTTDDLSVTFTVVPASGSGPVHSGDNTAVITVTDLTTGQPVDDASVVGAANMTAPQAPGEPSTGRYQGKGTYEVPLRVIATTYNVVIQIDRPTKPEETVIFPLDVWQ